MELVISIIIVLFLIVYAVYILSAAFTITGNKEELIAGDPGISITLVIPARNESSNLPDLFLCIEQNEKDYPYLNTIICDDHSTDKTLFVVEEWCAKKTSQRMVLVLNENEHGKKASIAKAVEHCTSQYILVTDADTIFGSSRVRSFAQKIKNTDAVLVTGVVKFNTTSQRFINAYQILENQALVMLGGAAIDKGGALTSNGANFCFSVNAFNEAGGYKGNNKILSGDDDFLLQTLFKKFPQRIRFNRDQQSWVETKVQNSFGSFMQQRIRWAKKTIKLSNSGPFITQIIITIFCMAVVFSIIAPVFGASLWWLLVPFSKVLIDLVFHHRLNTYYGNCPGVFNRIAASLFQVFIIPCIALATFFVKVQWKNREV